METLTVLSAWVWQPIASPLSIAGGAAVLAALAVFAYLRVFSAGRRAATCLLIMRLAAIAAVSLLLMGPSRQQPGINHEQKSHLAVLIDTSESMQTEDCGTESRIGFVAENVLNPDQLRRLQEDYDIDVQGFDERVHPVPLARLHEAPLELATGSATHLTDSVRATLSQTPAAADGRAVLLVSDGRDTEDASIQTAAALAASREIPVYTVAVGGTMSKPDAALLAVPMQDYLLPDEPGGILVKVYHSGLEHRSTTVRLECGNEVQRVPVRFGSGSVAEVRIPVQHPESGQYAYRVSLEPLPEEEESSNNEQIVFCEVMDRRIRVLILEGQPFWDTKFPAQSLRKDERIELTQITQVSGDKRETIVSRVEDRSPAVPASDEEWAEYDVVVLGRGLEHILDQRTAEQLVAFVGDAGGHVIFGRGLAYDPTSPDGKELALLLQPIEPVTWGLSQVQDLSIELTPTGRVNQWLSTTKMGLDLDRAFERLPGLEDMQTVDTEKVGTLVLARAVSNAGPSAEGMPALVTMNYGRGSVAGILGGGHWRWSLLTPENEDLRGFYDTFWSNLIRWLALGSEFQPGQQVSLSLSRMTARLGDPLTAEVSYKHAPPGDVPPTLRLIAPDGEAKQIALNSLPGRFPRFRANLEPEIVGLHRVELTAPGMEPAQLEQSISVYDVSLERLQTAANPLPLRMLAEHSGGVFFEAEEAGDLFDQLRRHRLSMLSPPKMEYIWDHGAVMTLLLVWIGIEWIVRRLTGLW